MVSRYFFAIEKIETSACICEVVLPGFFCAYHFIIECKINCFSTPCEKYLESVCSRLKYDWLHFNLRDENDVGGQSFGHFKEQENRKISDQNSNIQLQLQSVFKGESAVNEDSFREASHGSPGRIG